MLAKRLIPCLDVEAGRVVKGTRFVDLVDAGDPVELAARYDREGADELVFLDITATVEGRDSICPRVTVPVVASGGAGIAEHFAQALEAGRADAALAASRFHFEELSIHDVKELLARRGVEVRR